MLQNKLHFYTFFFLYFCNSQTYSFMGIYIISKFKKNISIKKRSFVKYFKPRDLFKFYIRVLREIYDKR